MEAIAGTLILTASLVGLITELIKLRREANQRKEEPIDKEA